MVVRIRFSMHGNRHNKIFHIVAINSKQRRDAKPLETLGIYKHTVDPAHDQTSKTVDWSVARIKYWLGVGAQPSKTAVRLFTQVSYIQHRHLTSRFVC
ncbi:ribosomal protein S16 domain-containing protein [Phellopilus nigrolimitatus]|nr:ribosomal protein S16 domain-containing protein [Phellopilus nigrolimitatus]